MGIENKEIKFHPSHPSLQKPPRMNMKLCGAILTLRLNLCAPLLNAALCRCGVEGSDVGLLDNGGSNDSL